MTASRCIKGAKVWASKGKSKKKAPEKAVPEKKATKRPQSIERDARKGMEDQGNEPE